MSPLEQNPEFEALLNYIKRNRGFDFTGYKRSTLMRRVQKRMQELAIESISEYTDYLEVDPQEFVALFNTILINVTSFFRDRPIWDCLATQITPRIVACKHLNEKIRVWSAGCASGQEAYTLAIVLAETLGLDQFRSRVKIYATEIDAEALHQARLGIYNFQEVEGVPPQLLTKYFERTDSHYTFRKDLRRCVIFGRHNLVQDPPISRIDLLVCRNTLMYFNAAAQVKIITSFAFALNEGGFLLLGKAEMLFNHSNTVKPFDLKRRIFISEGKVSRRDRLLLMAGNCNEFNYTFNDLPICEAAFNNNPVAQVVVDRDGLLILANERARMLYGLSSEDLGQQVQNLALSHQPIDLRFCIEQVYAQRTPVMLEDIEWTITEGDTRYFNIQLLPLFDINGSLLGVSITFTDDTYLKKLQHDLEQTNQELEIAYEELQSSNE